MKCIVEWRNKIVRYRFFVFTLARTSTWATVQLRCFPLLGGCIVCSPETKRCCCFWQCAESPWESPLMKADASSLIICLAPRAAGRWVTHSSHCNCNWWLCFCTRSSHTQWPLGYMHCTLDVCVLCAHTIHTKEMLEQDKYASERHMLRTQFT